MKPLAFLLAVVIALIPLPAWASWTNFTVVDEWGEEIPVPGARSALTAPTRSLHMFDEDLKAELHVVGCDRAWVHFTEVPYLTGEEFENNQKTYSIKARANGKEVTESMIAGLFSEDLSWKSLDAARIKGWANEESYGILIPLQWSGDKVWKFDMTGAQAAIVKTCPSAANWDQS